MGFVKIVSSLISLFFLIGFIFPGIKDLFLNIFFEFLLPQALLQKIGRTAISALLEQKSQKNRDVSINWSNGIKTLKLASMKYRKTRNFPNEWMNYNRIGIPFNPIHGVELS